MLSPACRLLSRRVLKCSSAAVRIPPLPLQNLLLSGITNYEEYSLIQEVAEDKKEDGVGTLRKDRTLLLRDERKMEKLKAKLHTDDDCE